MPSPRFQKSIAEIIPRWLPLAGRALEPPAAARRQRRVSPTFRARDLAMIATAAATCIVSACATAPVGGPVAAPPATITAAAPTGTATAGSATANAATAGGASAGSASASAAAVGNATANATAGSATATPIPVEGSPSPTGLPAGPVTQADNGKTFRLTVGQQLTVVLAKSPMMWDQPTAHGSAVARVSSSGGYPGTTPAMAVFRAVSPGTAQVTSATDMQCLHATPRCLPPQQIWSITVVVS
jgi:hypothetical protein